MFTAQIYYYWLTYVQDTRAMRIYVYTVAYVIKIVFSNTSPYVGP